jgi:hypothetical protein
MRYKAPVIFAAIAALLAGCDSGSSTPQTIGKSVSTNPPAPATTSPPPPPAVFVGGSSAGMLSNGVRIAMTLGAPTVQLDSNIAYKIELHNATSQRKTIGQGNIDCVLGGFAPALFDAKGKFPVDKPPLASSCKPATTLAAGGVAAFTGWLITQRVAFKSGARHGHFTVTLANVLDPQHASLASGEPPNLTPIPIAFDAPDLTIRIEVLNRAVPAGSVIKGTVVFDNSGDTDVSAGCASAPNYLIALSVMRDGQATLVNPENPQPNPSAPCAGRAIVLAPGTTRLPFAVVAKYYDCVPRGEHLIDGPYLPTCIRPHVPAPLPSGRYQLVYNGAAGVGAAVVPPASIEIRAAP